MVFILSIDTAGSGVRRCAVALPASPPASCCVSTRTSTRAGQALPPHPTCREEGGSLSGDAAVRVNYGDAAAALISLHRAPGNAFVTGEIPSEVSNEMLE